MSEKKESTALIHIDIGDWAKPANTLIEKCAEGIAAIARPMQIRRTAKAQVEAEKIYAVGQIEIEGIQRRALTRFIAEETKKQHNMESILAKALPDVKESAKPEDIEDDWIANFFDKCRLISDEQMQMLWARILAGEASAPGSFSKRTIGLVASLDKDDAIMFSTLCRFACSIGEEFVPVIFDYDWPIYFENGINFQLIEHLEDIGLANLGLYNYRVIALEQNTVIDYFGKKIPLRLELPTNTNAIAVGRVFFTRAGAQLAKTLEVKPLAGFFELLKETWARLIVPRSPGPFGPPQF